MTELSLPFLIEGDIEQRIAEHPDWLEGIEFGRPRHGHPEGQVKFHIAAVLGNVERFFGDTILRHDLRLITLIHDSFKYRVDKSKSRCGENHHGMIARRFAESIIDDESVLDVIELHDDAYNSWQCGNRDGRWDKAERRATTLVDRLGKNIDLYLAFYRCDNFTEGKESNCFEWFDDFVANIQNETSAGSRNDDDH